MVDIQAWFVRPALLVCGVAAPFVLVLAVGAAYDITREAIRAVVDYSKFLDLRADNHRLREELAKYERGAEVGRARALDRHP